MTRVMFRCESQSIDVAWDWVKWSTGQTLNVDDTSELTVNVTFTEGTELSTFVSTDDTEFAIGTSDRYVATTSVDLEKSCCVVDDSLKIVNEPSVVSRYAVVVGYGVGVFTSPDQVSPSDHEEITNLSVHLSYDARNSISPGADVSCLNYAQSVVGNLGEHCGDEMKVVVGTEGSTDVGHQAIAIVVVQGMSV